MTAADPVTTSQLPLKRKSLSLPPALLGRVAAAAFVSLSPSAWDRANAAALTPAAVRIAGRVAWSRRELQAWVDRGCPPRAVWAKVWPAVRDRRK